MTPAQAHLPPQDAMLDQIKASILESRGAHYPEAYRASDLLDPVLLADGVRAAARIAKALILRERIVLVADFDADGSTGAATLMRGLKMLAEAGGVAADLEYVIPDRFIYGYGLKPQLAEEVIRPLAPSVVITIDNGISSHEAVSQMNNWDMKPDIIITDHHHPGDTLPDAFAVVNPNRRDCSFPSKAICGCGVAFYVLLLVRQALVSVAGKRTKEAISKVKLARLTDLVAVGTVGDVVPMDRNNRLLVKIGLDRINKGWGMNPREAHNEGLLSFGIRALLEKAGAEAPITSSDIAFKVVPRLNAIGRLEKPNAGIECLLADTRTLAEVDAGKCDKANNERKTIQRRMEGEAGGMMDDLMADHADCDLAGHDVPAVVLYSRKWHPGVVGLLATHVKEQTAGAVICFSPDHDPKDATAAATSMLKGSGRSDSVHLRDALALVNTWEPAIRMQFGGHARAAGLSLEQEDLDLFTRTFEKAVRHLLALAPLENREWVDGPISPALRTLEFVKWIELQPWGQMFPEPLFRQSFVVESATQMKGPHMRLSVRDSAQAGRPMTLAWFNSLTGDSPLPRPGDQLELDYRLTVNRWRGREEIQGIVIAGRATNGFCDELQGVA